MRRFRIGEQDVLKVTLRIILPLFVGLSGMVVLPPLLCIGLFELLRRFMDIDGYVLFGNRFMRKLDFLSKDARAYFI